MRVLHARGVLGGQRAGGLLKRVVNLVILLLRLAGPIVAECGKRDWRSVSILGRDGVCAVVK